MFTLFISHLRTIILSLVAVAATTTPIPNPNAQNMPLSSGSSRNWSGYQASNGKFSQVSANWTIPIISGYSYTSADATWVGIGGIVTSDLIQIGTQNIIEKSGNISTSAFYELLPDVSQTIPVSVKSGDSVSANLSEQGRNRWLIAFKDNTTGQTFSTLVKYNSSYSTAEWIEEAPSSVRRELPLDNFGSISIKDASAMRNGNQVSIAQANSGTITMVNDLGLSLATPSNLGSDGANFTISRSNIPSSSMGISEFDPNSGSWRRQGVGLRSHRWIVPSETPQINPESISPDFEHNWNNRVRVESRRFFSNSEINIKSWQR